MNKILADSNISNATGPDGIPNELWIWLSPQSKLMLLELLNRCFAEASTSEKWQESDVTYTYKKTN